jgi:hypothetical protein
MGEISLTTFNVQIPVGLAIIGIYFSHRNFGFGALRKKGVYRITNPKNAEKYWINKFIPKSQTLKKNH